jgi:hypothetical protein
MISLGKGKGLYKEKGIEGECRGQISERGAKLGLEGEGILAKFLFSLDFFCKWDPETSFCMIRIWLFNLGMVYSG